ncbi:MAG TPA: hypothetical protein VKR52_21220 [Terracidiphilus sp.]|nr:hypothetical protein [Terracidiphilus sp.]
MRRNLLLLVVLSGFIVACAALPCAAQNWTGKLQESMPLLGHRNWILVVDSAYPLQTSTGIDVVETSESQLDVLRAVLHEINHSIHVRPVVYMDAELPFVPEADAPGVNAYRTDIADLLRPYAIESLPHDRLIATVAEASQHFHVLVLKTTLTVPYSSVFIRLDCKYWSDDAEKRLRARMGSGQRP